MRRTDRLFEIVQMFREGRFLTGRVIADRLEVSLRTVYRDIDTLVASGLPIEGERGLGYILREPIFLPPLTLAEDELDALHFALDQTACSGDAELLAVIDRLRAKVDAVLPERRRRGRFTRTLTNYARFPAPAALPLLRRAIRTCRRVDITYDSLAGECTFRTVRPLRLEWWGEVWTVVGWCEVRDDFRAFRVDRIRDCAAGQRFDHQPGRRYGDYLRLMEAGTPPASAMN